MTQLIALAGPSGAWRKSIIDKAITFVPRARFIALTEALTDGPRSMAHTRRAIPRFSTMLAAFCIKVGQSAHTVTIMLTNSPLEGNFVGAEPHLLASGTRDSARLLAQVYFDWAKAANALGSHAGIFALRGILPYAIRSHMYCETLLWIDIYSTAMFSVHVPSLRALSLTSLHLEKPFLLAPPVTRS